MGEGSIFVGEVFLEESRNIPPMYCDFSLQADRPLLVVDLLASRYKCYAWGDAALLARCRARCEGIDSVTKLWYISQHADQYAMSEILSLPGGRSRKDGAVFGADIVGSFGLV